MSPLDLDAVQARVDAASPGPWEWVGYPKPDTDLVASGIATIDEPRERTGIRPVVLEIHEGICPSVRDLTFIANARTDIPALVAELRAAQEETVELATELADERILHQSAIEVINAVRVYQHSPMRLAPSIERALAAYDKATGEVR